MERTLTLGDTSIGKKVLVALTGILLFGFVLQHMVANLQVFLGPEAINSYGANIKKLGPLLWVARLGLLAAVIAHIVLSINLALNSSAARPIGYRQKQSQATSFAARTMKWSGPMIACFIVYHIAHFTWPGVAMGAYTHQPPDLYANIVNGFRVPWVTAIYLVAQVLLGLHLYHGAWSLFQTLGLNHPRYNGLRQTVPRLIAITIVLGNVSMPLAVLAGVIS